MQPDPGLYPGEKKLIEAYHIRQIGAIYATHFCSLKIDNMITGAHAIIYSKNAEADREFFKTVLKLTNVDVGSGWLIFGLPTSELAVHPSSDTTSHELYLMCDDIKKFIEEVGKHNISCSEPQDQGWGILSSLILPGGGALGVYQPRHQRPEPM